MGVATGCGCKEVYRYPHTILIPTPLVSVLFCSSIPYFLFLKKNVFRSLLTLGAHARSEGYCSCTVCLCVCVCLFVVFCHHAHLDPEI